MLGKIITAQEATTNRAPKLKKADLLPVSPSSSNRNSDGSLDGGKKFPPGDAGSKPNGVAIGKRKSEGSDLSSGSDRVKKAKTTVTFSQDSNTTTTGLTKKTTKAPKIAKKVKSTRIGTRSSGEVSKIPELPPMKRRKVIKENMVMKDEACKVVKMLTGTLYLYRGDQPRAEFIRFK